MKKVKIGVMGAYRGTGMISYCNASNNAEVVAICDKFRPALDKQRELLGDHIAYYDTFDEFIKHDMDAVVLANYANEHAPFAIRALKAGKHVFSEVLPCQTMKEAVELIEAVEESGLVYAYGENYCYMPAPAEMRRLYRAGKIGEFEYGEGEYNHNCESIWHSITYGDPDHWRNNMYATFYCTHSMGPIIHITGLRPVKVTGFEGGKNERQLRVGSKSGSIGLEMVEMENGGIVKSMHGGVYKNSVWYSLYGSKGTMESAREITKNGEMKTIFINADEYSGEYPSPSRRESYAPHGFAGEALEKQFGHGGSDFYSMYHFVDRILGNKDADTIDVYEALDMGMVGMFAYRSILAGGIPVEIPNLRLPEEREKWRNDTACTDPKVAGDMLWPVFSKGNPDIPAEVYAEMKRKYEAELTADEGYIAMAFRQSSGKKK